MTHFDVSFLDLNGNERSHYDGKAVGDNLHACNSLSSTYTGNELPLLDRNNHGLGNNFTLDVINIGNTDKSWFECTDKNQSYYTLSKNIDSRDCLS